MWHPITYLFYNYDTEKQLLESEVSRLLLPILEKHKTEDVCFTTAIDEVEQNFEALALFEHDSDAKEKVIARMRERITELERTGRLDREKEALRLKKLKLSAKQEERSETHQYYYLITPI